MYCEYQYRLFANTRITSNKLKDTFATLLWATVGRREDAAHESQNSHRCGQLETVGATGGRQQMWQGVKWLCALVAASCYSVPDIAAIQTAYERVASAGRTLHDHGLQDL